MTVATPEVRPPATQAVRGAMLAAVAMAGAFAATPLSGLPWLRFPSPFIEPYVRVSRTWLLESTNDLESAYGWEATLRRL